MTCNTGVTWLWTRVQWWALILPTCRQCDVSWSGDGFNENEQNSRHSSYSINLLAGTHRNLSNLWYFLTASLMEPNLNTLATLICEPHSLQWQQLQQGHNVNKSVYFEIRMKFLSQIGFQDESRNYKMPLIDNRYWALHDVALLEVPGLPWRLVTRVQGGYWHLPLTFQLSLFEFVQLFPQFSVNKIYIHNYID